MKTVLITGAAGFIGKNLSEKLKQLTSLEVIEYSKNSDESLVSALDRADFVFHLAGVNRPKDEEEFKSGNRDFTESILTLLREKDAQTPVLLTSSTQAEQDNPYGRSKREAEELVRAYGNDTGASVYIYRLPNVFGKWCKPNYNSVIATFCYNITHSLPLTINDEDTELTLTYIDDVIDEFISCIGEKKKQETDFSSVMPIYSARLGDIANTLSNLHDMRETLVVPDLSSKLTKHLYSTLTSYYEEEDYIYDLESNADNRGWLSEFIKSDQFGQVFVSKTNPGFTRGNHWHHSKVEKFVIVEGEAQLSFRKVGGQETFDYKASGDKIQVVDVPVGYVHSVKNIGKNDMTMIIWANEILDKDNPDTYYEEV